MEPTPPDHQVAAQGVRAGVSPIATAAHAHSVRGGKVKNKQNILHIYLFCVGKVKKYKNSLFTYMYYLIFYVGEVKNYTD